MGASKIVAKEGSVLPPSFMNENLPSVPADSLQGAMLYKPKEYAYDPATKERIGSEVIKSQRFMV